MPKEKPVRVLQVVGGMNRGGVETWLMHVLRHIDRERFHFDFMVHATEPCAYDPEIRALGSNILSCPDSNRPWSYARRFKTILNEYGPYDVVHSHMNHFSGYVVWLAHQFGVPIRIAHSHEDSSRLQANAGPLRRIYLSVTKLGIRRYATVGLAPSRKAARALFGPGWADDRQRRIFYCGIDLTPFRGQVDKARIREQLGIPGDAPVLGHAGRFDEQKNHSFLVQIAAEVKRREPSMRLLLIGDGPLRPAVEQQVAELDLSGQVIFAGVRSDVPQLMQGAMDTFVMPSLYEGLPLVGLEAQTSGLPAVISDVITTELDMIPGLIQRLSLSQPASTWAETVLTGRKAMPALTQPEVLRVMEQSPFNIERSVKELEQIYAGEIQ